MTMTEKEVQKRVKEVEKAYKTFLKKLSLFEKEQDKILADFEQVLTKKRMKEIKKSLDIV